MLGVLSHDPGVESMWVIFDAYKINKPHIPSKYVFSIL